MIDYLKDILVKLIESTSEKEMKVILEDAINLVRNGKLTEEEAITFTTPIVNIKGKLGIGEQKHYDLHDIKDVIENTSYSCIGHENNIRLEIRDLYGLFSEDNTYILAQIANDSVYDIYGTAISVSANDIIENIEKIIVVHGERTYVVPAIKLYRFIHNRYTTTMLSGELNCTIRTINEYLKQNPKFIPTLFEQVESRQKAK